MSLLKLNCIDQVIIIRSAPVIASGGVEEDELEVEFCSKWDGYIKTAVFYKNEKEVYHVLLDANNKCTIPQEVTATEGKLYIGLFGINGTSRITTNIIMYKIVKGAILEGQKPIEPTPDIYTQMMDLHQQILAKYKDIFNSINDVVRDAVLQGVVNTNDETELLKFWVGTREEYDLITTKDVNTVYHVVDDEKEEEPITYLGTLSTDPKLATCNELNVITEPGLYMFNFYDENNDNRGSYLMIVSIDIGNGIIEQTIIHNQFGNIITFVRSNYSEDVGDIRISSINTIASKEECNTTFRKIADARQYIDYTTIQSIDSSQLIYSSNVSTQNRINLSSNLIAGKSPNDIIGFGGALQISIDGGTSFYQVPFNMLFDTYNFNVGNAVAFWTVGGVPYLTNLDLGIDSGSKFYYSGGTPRATRLTDGVQVGINRIKLYYLNVYYK